MNEADVTLVESSKCTQSTEHWSEPEKKMYKMIANPEDHLEFPLKPVMLPNGEIELMYVIDREHIMEVVKKLWPFYPVPNASQMFKDVHINRTCSVLELEVIRFEDKYNMIVSPYYTTAGGTVLDLMSLDAEGKPVDPFMESRICVNKPTAKDEKKSGSTTVLIKLSHSREMDINDISKYLKQVLCDPENGKVESVRRVDEEKK